MSELKEPPPVRLFIGIIYNESAPLNSCLEKFPAEFGKIDFISNDFPFNYTSYYEKEMGKDLWRKIISFRKLINRDEIVNAKIFTNKLEVEFRRNNCRSINLDPGYISSEHLILATGKGYYHRPYIGKGVYADLTLVYQDKKFKTLEWTYPDYKCDYMQDIFRKLRKEYLNELKQRNIE